MAHESCRRDAPSLAIYFHRLSEAGGAEHMSCQLANALSTRGHRVHLVSWDALGATPFHAVSKDVTWHRLGFSPGLLDKARRFLVLARLLRREKIQVLIGFVMSGDKTVYAAAKAVGVRLVAAERNAPSMYLWRHGAFRRRQCFFLLRWADRVVVQFEEFAKGYPKALHGRMAAIPNPVTSAGRRAAPETANAAGRYTLLAVGRLDEIQKRLTCLVDSFSEIASEHPAWDLEIVGDGPDRLMLADRIAEHGLQGRAHLSPARPDIADAYVSSHLFAIPSRWEGFPNALAEALAHGLPAVGFAGSDGVAHLIDDGETGWLARGIDGPAALAEALGRAMSDPTERARRGMHAVQAMTAYPPDPQFDKWQALVADLAGTARRGVPV